jgi:hypothetical protein
VYTGGLLALAASLAISACGGDSVQLAELAPPDAPLYGEFVVRPDDGQAEAIDSFADRVAGVDDPKAPIVAKLEQAFAENNVELDFAEDIEPLLGERGAFFVRSFEPVAVTEVADDAPDFAFMVQTDDEGEARSFLESAAESDPAPDDTRSYGGFEYFVSPDDDAVVGLIEDVLVIATETSFKVAVDASEGESLAASEEYSAPVAALGDELLATLFLEPRAAIEAAMAAGDLDRKEVRLLRPLVAGPLSDPLAIGLSATPDTATLDFASTIDGREDIATDESLIEGLPGGSWLAVGVPDLRGSLAGILDQLANSGLPGGGKLRATMRELGIDPGPDALGWLGEAAGFVEGTSAPTFTAGVIAEVSEPEGPRPLLERVQAIAERDSGLRSAAPPEGADYGFSLGPPSIGGGVEAGLIDERLVAVVGGSVAQALDPESTLGDDPAYEAAVEPLGDEFQAGLVVHLPSFFEVAEQGGSAADLGYQAARPYLEAFESLAAGARVEDDLALTRVTVSLAE